MTSLATKVVEAIADCRNIEPAELDLSLAEYIDPDALTQLDQHDTGIWMLTFTIPDHGVTVTSDRDILIDNEPMNERI